MRTLFRRMRSTYRGFWGCFFSTIHLHSSRVPRTRSLILLLGDRKGTFFHVSHKLPGIDLRYLEWSCWQRLPFWISSNNRIFYVNWLCCESIPYSHCCILSTRYEEIRVLHEVCLENIFSMPHVDALGSWVVSCPEFYRFIGWCGDKKVARFIPAYTPDHF